MVKKIKKNEKQKLYETKIPEIIKFERNTKRNVWNEILSDKKYREKQRKRMKSECGWIFKTRARKMRVKLAILDERVAKDKKREATINESEKWISNKWGNFKESTGATKLQSESLGKGKCLLTREKVEKRKQNYKIFCEKGCQVIIVWEKPEKECKSL